MQISPSPNARIVLKNLHLPALKLLAASQNRLELLMDLTMVGNFDTISEALGLEENYKVYERRFNEEKNQSAKEQAALISNYMSFLIEKICLPPEFDKIEF